MRFLLSRKSHPILSPDDSVLSMLTRLILSAQSFRERNPSDSPTWGPPSSTIDSFASQVHNDSRWTTLSTVSWILRRYSFARESYTITLHNNGKLLCFRQDRTTFVNRTRAIPPRDDRRSQCAPEAARQSRSAALDLRGGRNPPPCNLRCGRESSLVRLSSFERAVFIQNRRSN